MQQETSILIVDDHEDNCRPLLRLLKRAGFAVKHLCDSTQAMEMVKRERPDLLILDIMMPKVDGLELLSEVRQEQELEGTAVMMFSALTDPRVQSRAKELGACDYLVKPMTWPCLLARIQHTLQRSAA
ncbi:MAG TPA: response regulator [Tepidisphaeraceae bacterium]|jgi:PleD family two-component response regulator